MNCFKPRKRIILERINKLEINADKLLTESDIINHIMGICFEESWEYKCYYRAINRMWRLYAKNTQNNQI